MSCSTIEQTKEYAWDEPAGVHKLLVEVESVDGSFDDISSHEYVLDDLRVRASFLCNV